MILPNMDGEAIAKAISNDKILAEPFLLHKQARFEKKRFGNLCHVQYEWKCRPSGNKYIITLSSNLLKDKRTRCSFMCEAENTKGKMWYAEIDINDPEYGVMGYTSHFFKRYAERYLHKTAVFPDIVSEYEALNSFSSRIWHDEDHKRGVYAVKTGLLLCSKRDQIVYVNTFVSRDLLKPSQLKAFDAIVNNIDYYDSVIPTYYRSNSTKELLKLQAAEKAIIENEEICHEIYNEYYEK